MKKLGQIHFVGSLLGDSAEDVFRACGESVGDLLATLPDGETGNRSQYTLYVCSTTFKDHPDMEVLSQPHPIDPDNPYEWRKPEQDWMPRMRQINEPVAGKEPQVQEPQNVPDAEVHQRWPSFPWLHQR